MLKKLKKSFNYFFISAFFLNGFYINPSIAEQTISGEVLKEENIIKSSLKTDYFDQLAEDDYILGPGDSLRVIVSRNYPELFKVVTIDANGTIYLPRIKRIYIKGLTVTELTRLLDLKFKEFVKFPDSEIEIEKYRKIKVLVNGEVSKPGLQEIEGSMRAFQTTETAIKSPDNFDINNIDLSILKTAGDNLNLMGALAGAAGQGLTSKDEVDLPSINEDLIPQMNEQNVYFPTVMDAIRESGGITEYTDLSNIEIIRKDTISNGGGRIKALLNLEDIMDLDNPQNIRIYDGDVINISKKDKSDPNLVKKSTQVKLSPKTISVLVTGRVLIPGIKNISREYTLNEAIDYAGGTLLIKGPVYHIRTNDDSTITKRKIRYNRNYRRGSYKNPYLKEGDIVVVGDSALALTGATITAFTTPVTGVLSTYALIKALRN